MPFITVDDVRYEVEEGRTLLQALDDLGILMNGVDVPHYCWHPKLSIDGSCRLCQVEIEGMPKLQIACNTVVQDEMVVRTTTERVRRAREGVMELLLVNHPLDCPICDQAGECKLQDYAYEYGVLQSRTVEPRRALKKRVDLGPTIVFDQERCILCRRCVRFCREIPGTGELAVFDRGDRSTIETFPGSELDNDYSMNVADICPVGALTTKDFRFKIRVWFLEDVEGVCTACANGCNIHLGVSKGEVYRYVPRRNDAVNDTWICDPGRLSYREIGSEARIRSAAVRSSAGELTPVPAAEAIHEAARRLEAVVSSRGPGVVAGVASGHATNEDLFAFSRFLDAAGVEARALAVVRGEADALLQKVEKAANGAGARALGFAAPDSLVERIRGGGIEALVVFGHDLLGEDGLESVEALARVETLVLIDTLESPLQDVASVVLPARHAAEKHGTLTNHAGRVQRVRPAVEPAFEALAEGEAVWRIGGAMGLAGFDAPWDVREVSKALCGEVAAFAGLDLESLGPGGRPLAGADGRADVASDPGSGS
ncbi:MAG: 2Fe-2S iron-sulfur cluster-binding protein [Myxococcota bacterium]